MVQAGYQEARTLKKKEKLSHTTRDLLGSKANSALKENTVVRWTFKTYLWKSKTVSETL